MRNYSNGESSLYGGPSASGVLSRHGVDAARSVGAQISHYDARTKYLLLQPTCHL